MNIEVDMSFIPKLTELVTKRLNIKVNEVLAASPPWK